MDWEGNVAYIKLSQRLDYETITEYTLTVQVMNIHLRTAEILIKIEILDVNDNIPFFHDYDENVPVRENEPAGVPVMQVRAFDHDATSAHNQVNINVS